MYPVEERGDIDVDDVAVLDDGRVGDTVADHFVEAGAARLREALVTQRRRVRTVVAEELMYDTIHLVRGDPGLAMLPGEDGRLRGEPAGNPHPRDDVRRLDGPVGPLRLPLADVLRTGDVGRHLPPRGLLTGFQRGSHVHPWSLSLWCSDTWAVAVHRCADGVTHPASDGSAKIRRGPADRRCWWRSWPHGRRRAPRRTCAGTIGTAACGRRRRSSTALRSRRSR